MEECLKVLKSVLRKFVAPNFRCIALTSGVIYGRNVPLGSPQGVAAGILNARMKVEEGQGGVMVDEGWGWVGVILKVGEEAKRGRGGRWTRLMCLES